MCLYTSVALQLQVQLVVAAAVEVDHILDLVLEISIDVDNVPYEVVKLHKAAGIAAIDRMT